MTDKEKLGKKKRRWKKKREKKKTKSKREKFIERVCIVDERRGTKARFVVENSRLTREQSRRVLIRADSR